MSQNSAMLCSLVHLNEKQRNVSIPSVRLRTTYPPELLGFQADVGVLGHYIKKAGCAWGAAVDNAWVCVC